jgi:glycosyltransferase involved in cell wall biosynthesis
MFKQGDTNSPLFVLSGEGDCGEAWRREAAGVDNVIFTGWIDGVELHWLRNRATIGLAAYARSAPQSLPNKIFEYLSAGIPVLSSLEGEAKVLLASQELGLSYRAGDPEDLHDKLLVYLRDGDKRREASLNCVRIFDECFSSEIVYGQFTECLQSACCRNTESLQDPKPASIDSLFKR